MNQSIALVLCALTAVILTGCDFELDGDIKVAQTLTLKNDKNKAVTMVPGAYKTEVEYKKKKNRLELDLKVNGKKQEFLFALPAGFEFPKKGGSFVIPAQVSGQPLDFGGHLTVAESDSEEMSGYESCSYQTYGWTCDDRGNCYYGSITQSGSQEVHYYYHYTTYDLDAALLPSGQSTHMATVAGVKRESEKVYTYYGECR